MSGGQGGGFGGSAQGYGGSGGGFGGGYGLGGGAQSFRPLGSYDPYQRFAMSPGPSRGMADPMAGAQTGGRDNFTTGRYNPDQFAGAPTAGVYQGPGRSDPMAEAQTGGQMTWGAPQQPQIQQAQMSQPFQQQAPQQQAPMDPYAQSQDAYNAAISGNNGTANARPLWMQQGPIEQENALMPKATTPTPPRPPNTSNPGVTPLNLPPNGGVPPKPTGPMQPGQVDWGWDNQRNQFAPSWTPQARQFILQNAYGSGTPAPWLTQGVRNAEWTDPNYLQTIGNLSGNRFGG